MGCPQGLIYGGKATILTKQIVGVLTTIAWSSSFTYIILKIIDYTVGLRVSAVKELQGLDTAVHGESIVAGHMVTNNTVKSYEDQEFNLLMELPSLLKDVNITNANNASNNRMDSF